MTIETTISVWREGKQFIARALALDVASAGDTPEAARLAVREAVRLFVETARQKGTIDEVLEECGYSFDGSAWIVPTIVAQEEERISV